MCDKGSLVPMLTSAAVQFIQSDVPGIGVSVRPTTCGACLVTLTRQVSS